VSVQPQNDSRTFTTRPRAPPQSRAADESLLLAADVRSAGQAPGLVRGTYAVAIVLIGWELIRRYVLTSKLMFAPLSAVLAEFAKLWATGELERHMFVSFMALAVGFTIAAVVGIALGSLIAISDAVGGARRRANTRSRCLIDRPIGPEMVRITPVKDIKMDGSLCW
jgi:hypothetical protein